MKKFELPVLPSKATTKVVHIRFPASIAEQVKEEIKGKSCTFSAFVVEAARFALEDLESKNI